MSPLAELCHARGLATQGSDISASEGLERLRGLGIPICAQQDASLLQHAKSLVVSSAITDANPELIEAKKLGLPIFHRSDILQMLMADKRAITVAGTHGKTTTTALICHMLTELGLDPSAAVGGAMVSVGSPARCGKGAFFVAEADESDGSFLKYTPEIAVLNNVDFDHMDYFKTQENLETAFHQYLRNTRKEGSAIIGWDSPLARAVGSRPLTSARLTFGQFLGSEVRALDYRCRDGFTSFTAIIERDTIPVELHAIGRHNVFNALATLAVARALKLDVRAAAQSLKTFAGVERRLQPVLETPTLKIFDDYGHNPGKTTAAIAAIKESWPDWRLIVIHQPHRYSRMETMYDSMLGGLAGADEALLLPIYAAGEKPSREYSLERLAEDAARLSRCPVRGVADPEEAMRLVAEELQPKSIVLTLGAGNVSMISHQLKARLASPLTPGGRHL
jgi:UDP-N-acetylmuramate--alanine ligase